MKKWKTLMSKMIFEHPRIMLYEDEVELPNGTVTKYLHYGCPEGGAMILAVNKDGEVLIQREYSYPPDEILWQLPGGKIDKGETPMQAALRELSEECDLTGELEEIGWFYLDNRRKPSKMTVFIARNITDKSGVKDAEETLEHQWMSVDEVDTLISNHEFQSYTGLAGWAIYKNYLKMKS